MEHYRHNYLATGHALGPAPGLLWEQSDYTGLQLVLGIASLLLFAAWPFERAGTKTKTPNFP
jgi:hypothetical protein